MEDFLNAVILLSNFIIVPAISYGCQLALGALGATIIYSILRFSNFAHAETMAFGAMVTIVFTWLLQSFGISLGIFPTALLALPIGIFATAIICLLTDRWVYSYYRAKKAAPIFMVMTSFGVMFVMNGLIRFIIGPGEQKFIDGERFIVSAKNFKATTGFTEGITIKMTQGITLFITIITVTWLFYFLHKTRTGKAMRAYSDNQDLATLSGINSKKVVQLAWIITAALATIAGTLYGLDKVFKPFNYMELLLPIFAATIIGGIGNPLGAIAGGFTIAFAEQIITYAYKKFFIYILPDGWVSNSLYQFISTDYKVAISFLILVLILLIRPTGIFKGKML